MIVFHFYIENKLDRLRTELMIQTISHRDASSRPDLVLPPYHVQQMQPAPHGPAIADNSSLIPTVADIAVDNVSTQWTYSSDTPSTTSVSGLLPPYEDGDMFAKYS